MTRNSETAEVKSAMNWNPTVRRSVRRLVAAGALAAAVAWIGPTASTQATITCETGDEKQRCIVSGRITSDTTFSADSLWLLDGAVFVDEPARLTIEAGTEIFGRSETNGTLVISRGAQILANGTAEAPIVMTSDQEVGERARADWGGLIINGRAPLNVPGGEGEGEGGTGVYGGNNPDDDSGHLYYVRVEFAGTELSPDNELNGIAFQGVGRNTEVDHIMVSFNKDDGLEFFGGTVEVKHVICFAIADDSFDWTDGWQGKGQFLIAQQMGDDADNGFESDNNGDNNDLTPRSNPTLYNVTLIGDPYEFPGEESDIGMLLREGTAATIRNFIITGFKEAAIDIDHTATFTQVTQGNLTLESGLVYGNCIVDGCEGQFKPDSDDAEAPITTMDFVTGAPNVYMMDPVLGAPSYLCAFCPFDLVDPTRNFAPRAGSPALSGLVRPSVPPNDGFFDVANFIGAVGPAGSGQDDWFMGWTDFTLK
jgi:hypothetical protein